MRMKPLNGLRILEFDGLGPVTFAGLMLADMGAEVLRLTRAASAGAPVFAEVGGALLHRGRTAVVPHRGQGPLSVAAAPRDDDVSAQTQIIIERSWI